MNVIHFCSYYIGSDVYANLFRAIDSLGLVKQDVFVPTRRCKKNRGEDIKSENITIKRLAILSIFTRLFISLKIILILCFSLLIYRGYKFSVVHAHTLFSDGIAAYLYSRLRGARFVVTVRNTDVNLAVKVFILYRPIVKYILKKADAVIFVSPKHRDKIFSYLKIEREDNVFVVPNGVDDIFVQNSINRKVGTLSDEVCIIFVGSINKNKNIKRAMEACERLENIFWKFVVVGGTKAEYQSVYGVMPDFSTGKVEFAGRVLNKKDLIELYDSAHIFCMPSHRETFGLVYIEAISRCLPVVYSRGQGIDGYFQNGEVGFACKPSDVNSIKEALSGCLTYFPSGLGPYKNENPVERFSWSKIAKFLVRKIYLSD